MGKTRVLVVDDDPKIRAVLRTCLEEDGLSVIEAADAETALKDALSTEFDLITLDLHLEDKDGLEVARIIRTKSDVPIIMVTGKDDLIDRVVHHKALPCPRGPGPCARFATTQLNDPLPGRGAYPF